MFDFVARQPSTFHGKVLNVLHMEFDVKGKKLLSNRSHATENILASFECLYAREKARIQT